MDSVLLKSSGGVGQPGELGVHAWLEDMHDADRGITSARSTEGTNDLRVLEPWTVECRQAVWLGSGVQLQARFDTEAVP